MSCSVNPKLSHHRIKLSFESIVKLLLMWAGLLLSFRYIP